MEYNFDALDIIFKIHKREDKETLLKYAFDYYQTKEYDVQQSLIQGWNTFVTLGGNSWRLYRTPTEEFIKEVNLLYKKVNRQRIIGSLISESNG